MDADELRRENAKLRARLDDRAKRDAIAPHLGKFRADVRDMAAEVISRRLQVADDGTVDATAAVDAYLRDNPAVSADHQAPKHEHAPASDRRPPSIREVIAAELAKQEQGGGS